MKLTYQVELTAKAKLAGIPEVIGLELTQNIIAGLSDKNAEVLARCTSGYDQRLKEVQPSSLTLFDLTHKIIQQKLKREAETRKHERKLLEKAFDADVDELIVTVNPHGKNETRSLAKSWSGMEIPWDSTNDWKRKRDLVLARLDHLEKLDVKMAEEKARAQEEKEALKEAKEAQREEFLMMRLDDLDQERRKDGLLSDSEARGLMLDWLTRELWGFGGSTEPNAAFTPVFIRPKEAESLVDLGACCCGYSYVTWTHEETQSLSRDEYKEFKRLKRSITEANNIVAEEFTVSVEPRKLSRGCPDGGCSNRVKNIPGIKLSLNVGDWEMSRLYVFRSTL